MCLFNVGNKRRKQVEGNQLSDFFSGENEEAKQIREQLATSVLQEALEWLEQAGNTFAIFDATNTTNSRRQGILKLCHEKAPEVKVVFIERF